MSVFEEEWQSAREEEESFREGGREDFFKMVPVREFSHIREHSERATKKR